MKPRKILSRICILILTCFVPAVGIVFPQTPGEMAPLFQSHELLHLTITMDTRTVLNDVDEETNQYPSQISYLSEEGEEIIVPVRIRTRGHFRRDKMNCDFPPLRLNFARATSGNSIFSAYDKIKLVSHCRSRGKQYEQNVLKEYLAYRLFNLLTEESYRVRLVEFNYADSEGEKDTIKKMGFLLEPTDFMATRNNLNYIEINYVQYNQCDWHKTTVLSVFQYMIGNTDWSIPAPHNIDLIQDKPSDPPVAVPFDFDWCGLVDAPYALPNDLLDIEDVRTRLFRGFCRSEEEFEKVFQEFRDVEEDMYETIRSIPGLNKREFEKILKYIEKFFITINNPRMVKNEFYNKCRTK